MDTEIGTQAGGYGHAPHRVRIPIQIPYNKHPYSTNNECGSREATMQGKESRSGEQNSGGASLILSGGVVSNTGKGEKDGSGGGWFLKREAGRALQEGQEGRRSIAWIAAAETKGTMMVMVMVMGMKIKIKMKMIHVR
jgi:hypothetical protein